MFNIDTHVLAKVMQAMQKSNNWDSLIINRRKPVTYRIFTQLDSVYRACLHKFEPCEASDTFMHPHPWPGTFIILEGEYVQTIGLSDGYHDSPEIIYKERLTAGSQYEITHPRVWHSVQPLTTCYTLMINGEPWLNPHLEVRTTKGKDLEKMTDSDKASLMDYFYGLLEHQYNNQWVGL